MRNIEESGKISLCGEGMQICIAYPKYMFVKAFYSNMLLYISDTTFPIKKRKNEQQTNKQTNLFKGIM